MAAAGESTCHSDPNFAVICSFVEKYGELLGLPDIPFVDLQDYLEDTKAVSRPLIDLHVRLLKRIGKTSVNHERFERSIVKFCFYFSDRDAWEVERFGYRHAQLSTKLRVLKNLLECQFDYNVKFKEKVNEFPPEEMRFLPAGRDRDGMTYWYLVDKDFNLFVYREEPDDENAESWKLLCSDRDELASLVDRLRNNTQRNFMEDDKDKSSVFTDESKTTSKEGSPEREEKPPDITMATLKEESTDVKHEPPEGSASEMKSAKAETEQDMTGSAVVKSFTVKREPVTEGMESTGNWKVSETETSQPSQKGEQKRENSKTENRKEESDKTSDVAAESEHRTESAVGSEKEGSEKNQTGEVDSVPETSVTEQSDSAQLKVTETDKYDKACDISESVDKSEKSNRSEATKEKTESKGECETGEDETKSKGQDMKNQKDNEAKEKSASKAKDVAPSSTEETVEGGVKPEETTSKSVSSKEEGKSVAIESSPSIKDNVQDSSPSKGAVPASGDKAPDQSSHSEKSAVEGKLTAEKESTGEDLTKKGEKESEAVAHDTKSSQPEQNEPTADKKETANNSAKTTESVSESKTDSKTDTEEKVESSSSDCTGAKSDQKNEVQSRKVDAKGDSWLESAGEKTQTDMQTSSEKVQSDPSDKNKQSKSDNQASAGKKESRDIKAMEVDSKAETELGKVENKGKEEVKAKESKKQNNKDGESSAEQKTEATSTLRDSDVKLKESVSSTAVTDSENASTSEKQDCEGDVKGSSGQSEENKSSGGAGQGTGKDSTAAEGLVEDSKSKVDDSNGEVGKSLTSKTAVVDDSDSANCSKKVSQKKSKDSEEHDVEKSESSVSDSSKTKDLGEASKTTADSEGTVNSVVKSGSDEVTTTPHNEEETAEKMEVDVDSSKATGVTGKEKEPVKSRPTRARKGKQGNNTENDVDKDKKMDESTPKATENQEEKTPKAAENQEEKTPKAAENQEENTPKAAENQEENTPKAAENQEENTPKAAENLVNGHTEDGEEPEKVTEEQEVATPKKSRKAVRRGRGGSRGRGRKKRGGSRGVKRTAPQVDSEDNNSEPAEKRAKQVGVKRGGAAARGRRDAKSADQGRDDEKSSDSDAPLVNNRGRGKGGRGGGAKTPTKAGSKVKANSDGEEAGESSSSDDLPLSKAAKKKKIVGEDSSDFEPDEPVTPAKTAGGVTKANTTPKAKKTKPPVAQKKAEEETDLMQMNTRRSMRIRTMKKKEPTPELAVSCEEASGELSSEVDLPTDEDTDDDDEFKPRQGRNRQRQAALKKKEEEREPVDDTPCLICQKSTHPDMMLLCDSCDKGYHMACLRPPLMAIPEGDWFCPPCEHVGTLFLHGGLVDLTESSFLPLCYSESLDLTESSFLPLCYSESLDLTDLGWVAEW
ncbi:hypothetical protein V1264_010732 [Littorina saxatilis]|uniref:PHD-type domain-containing protein n=1 Tax=Littorina saxatilis TaxID=31220 RepID=A0AAN9APZ3_9CAEN